MGARPKFAEEDDLRRALELSEETARLELVERQVLAAAMHISQQDSLAATADDQRLQRLLEGTVAEAFCSALSRSASPSCVADDICATTQGGPVTGARAASAASGCCCIGAKEPPIHIRSSPTKTWTQELDDQDDDSSCAAAGSPAPPAPDALDVSRARASGQGGTWASHVLSELDDSIHAHDALRISAELAEEIRRTTLVEEAGEDVLLEEKKEEEDEEYGEDFEQPSGSEEGEYDGEDDGQADARSRASRASCESEWVDGLDSFWAGEEQLVQESEPPRPLGPGPAAQGGDDEEDTDWLLVGSPNA